MEFAVKIVVAEVTKLWLQLIVKGTSRAGCYRINNFKRYCESGI
jgi:hypothetical protein